MVTKAPKFNPDWFCGVGLGSIFFFQLHLTSSKKNVIKKYIYYIFKRCIWSKHVWFHSFVDIHFEGNKVFFYSFKDTCFV